MTQNWYLNFKMYKQRCELTCTMRKHWSCKVCCSWRGEDLGVHYDDFLVLKRQIQSWCNKDLHGGDKEWDVQVAWRRDFCLNTRNKIFAVRTHPLDQPLQGHGWVLIAGGFQADGRQIISFTFLFPWGSTRWFFEDTVNLECLTVNKRMDK